MILGTGIDMVEIGRIRKSMENPRFLTRVFSSEEQELFRERGFPPQTVAANFCAKEAFSKALGTGLRGFALSEISVLRDELGKPWIKLDGAALELAKRGGYSFSLSLTHTREYAAAVVICTGLKGEEI
ncbi:MAG: holo-ACP synthase [Oscillospiraceae bacterium]|nr:holo-ACP synthase [Oscillospiraceae bacterium]